MQSNNSPLIRSTMLTGLEAAARELDMDLLPALRASGLAPTLLEAQEHFVSRQAFSQCLELLAEQYNCPHLGLVVARHSRAVGSGALAQLAKASPTLGAALANAYPRLRLYTDARWHIKRDGSHVELTCTVPHSRNSQRPQIQSLSIAQHAKAIRELLGDHWAPTSVSFAFPAPEKRQHYKRYFAAPVYFDQEYDGLRFPAQDLDIPITSHDPELLAILEHYLASPALEIAPDLAGRVSTIICQQLGNGRCGMQDVANILDWHPKALQRALRAEGSTFKDLLLSARLDLAEQHLSRSRIGLAALADMLGYSCPSALSRAFKQRHGMSPRAWRQRMAADRPSA
ncbi:AraC family transcriptional regulator [Parahaliea mediterranea]|uniref:AraC family transcriptional regulator n=1 Tax=Parahaliea mediterranea TaxID=651086 RepID=A0A939DDE9_9GAMM|nr:AraC family transcriptional regulator [Parahaliea mediterranea]MBN7795532.1 AraC family transcriptional regulator [Parahaliea mediterranea]